jgi:hypothetical protein
LEQNEADEYNRILWDDGLIAAAFKHAKEQNDMIDPEESLYDFFVEKSKDLFKTDSQEYAERKRTTFLQFVQLWGAYIGSPIARQSLKHFWLEECLEGENPFVAGTYHKILDAVAGPAKRGADIKLDCEVRSLEYVKYNGTHNTQVVHVESQIRKSIHAEETTVQVQTSDGTTHKFDHVVVTTPLGWLKNNQHCFEPQLPASLRKAIHSISYGSLDKVYVTFPSAFWQSSTDANRMTHTNGLDPEACIPQNLRLTTA